MLTQYHGHRNRRLFKSKLAIAALLGSSICSSLGNVAIASGAEPRFKQHGFGTSADPDFHIADNGLHTYASTETNLKEKALMKAIFNSRMTVQFGDRTQLDIMAVPFSENTDAYWYVSTAAKVADATCMDYYESEENGARRCKQTRIRFNTDWAKSQTLNEKRQGACHEIGHSLGFDDSIPENNIGCMSSGGRGVLSAHEIAHINLTYNPY